jgi:hypothetical protein
VSKVELEDGGAGFQAVEVLELVLIPMPEVKHPLDFAVTEDGIAWKIIRRSK